MVILYAQLFHSILCELFHIGDLDFIQAKQLTVRAVVCSNAQSHLTNYDCTRRTEIKTERLTGPLDSALCLHSYVVA